MSDPAKLIPGTYTLARDVENPKADRRKRSDWTAREVWRKGMTFVVREEPVTMPEGMADRIIIRLTTPTGVRSLTETSEQVQVILPHLIVREEKPSEWLNRMDHGINMAPDILDYLVETGKLTVAEFEAAYSQCIDDLKKKDDE